MKHITQSLGQPATLHHPVKHTHTQCLWERGAPFKACVSLYGQSCSWISSNSDCSLQYVHM